MPDHYELIGVDRGADKDEIRAAYQSRKEALEADTSDDARAELGRLNEAWQTLADPYQRGRYDAALDSDAVDDTEVVEADDAAAEEPPPRRRGLFQPPEPRPAQERKPTITIPPGVRLAENRPRLNAMMFDLAIVILLAVTTQLVGQQIVRNQYPDEIDRVEEIADEVELIDDEIDRRDDAENLIEDLESDIETAEANGEPTGELESQLEEARSASDNALEANRARAAELEAQTGGADADTDGVEELAELEERAELISLSDAELEARREALVDEDEELRSDLQPANTLVFGIGVALGLIYLVGFGVRGGQTPGKRLRKVRVVQMDGSPLTFKGALIRYGAPALFAAVTFMFLLGVIGFALAMFGVLMWMRSPNGQGLHDRLAGTLVVEDLPGSTGPVKR